MTSSRVRLGLSMLALGLSAHGAPGEGAELSTRVAELRRAHGLDTRHGLALRALHRDESAGTHARYQQTYLGLRVFGGEAILHTDARGHAQEPTLALHTGIDLNPDPAMTPAEALSRAEALAQTQGTYSRAPQVELLVVPEESVTLRPGASPQRPNALDQRRELVRHTLAYHVHLELEHGAAETRHVDLLLNAHTGGLIRQWESLPTAGTKGTGRSQYSGTVTLDTNTVASGFELRDTTRGVGGSFGSNAVTNLNHGVSGTGTVYTDVDNIWGDGTNYGTSNPATTGPTGQTAAVDAAYGLQATWDYYGKIHGRRGIDGTGRATYARVHYSSGYDNAFWSDACFCMTYGDGSVLKSLTALDVAGHELTHGVIASTAKLIYSGESGGLNEAHADIHGTLAEFHARSGAGATVPNTAPGANWTLGEQLTTPQFPNPLRYLAKPSKDGRSPDAWSPSLAGLDVHYSSGPMNRAFYFLAQGASATAGAETYSSYLPEGMTGVGNDHAARISYRALTAYMTATTTYAAARVAYISAAKALYGAGSPEEKAVWNAFAAINVGGKWIVPDTTAPSASVKVTGTSGTVTFTATASDNIGVARVEFWVDGFLKGTLTAAPYTLPFASTTLANGPHVLVARAYDAAGNLGVSGSQAFTVTNVKDTTAPVVSIKASGNAGTVTFTATATDNVGVTRVDFLVDNAVVGTATTAPFTLTFNSATLLNGAHTLGARAADAAGNQGIAPLVAWTVANPTDPTVMTESEPNNTAAGANPIGSLVKTVRGTLPTGTDADFFALPVSPGQTVTLTLTSPAGRLYGLILGPAAVTPRTAVGGTQRIQVTAPTRSATATTFYLQVYSLTAAGSPSPYTLTIQR